jgi:nitrous oxidase accessory protein
MKNLILRTRFLALVLVIIASGCIGIPESPTGNNYETIDKAPIVVCSSGCNFNSIQDAIDSAKVGDIVEVNSGTYYENVEINKRIILRGRDTGNGFPIIDAWGHGSAITLKTNGIVLEKIIAINSSDSTDYSPSGISVYSNDNVIRFNRIRGGHNGIYLSNADNNRIEGNDVENCEYGVGLYQSNDNKISKNKISNNLH